ncbi:MAG: alanine racemase [Acidobacteria bacterium]|nr:alanine racemase [Acidobacteriota bacterium]
MSSANSQAIGLHKLDLETPALCLDLGRYERNVERMVDYIIRRAGIAWRPHMKGQKAAPLAQRAVAAGAIGVTCATVYEAEAMAEAGIRSILLAHEVVGERKLCRLAALQRKSTVIAATDSEAHLAMLAAAALAESVTIPVIIELNVGMNRSGIAPGQPTLQLARRAHTTPGIRFLGLMGWEGHVLAFDDEEKKRQTQSAIAALTDTAQLCRDAGLPVEIVSSSGSGTFRNAAPLPGITEVQAGGGVFSDRSYAAWGLDHEFSLTVLTRVASRPSPTRIITDGGFKTMSKDHGFPEPLGLPPAKKIVLSAEHGNIELNDPSETPRVGDTIEWVPGYTDSTVCLHDEMVVLRDDIVTEVWTIPGRGGRR